MSKYRHQQSFWRAFISLSLSLFIIGTTLTGCNCSKAAALSFISSLEGEVQIKKAGSTEWVKAQTQDSLAENDIIKTSKSSRVTITFFDGSIIDLNSDTQVEIREIIKGKTTGIRLKQEIGETLSKIKKLIDTGSTYEIETPVAVASVRGSTMSIAVMADGTTTVANIEGTISVTAQGKEVAVPEGKHSTVTPGAAPGPPLEGTISIIAKTPVFIDTLGDWFDSQKRQVNGPEYLDIASSQISFIDGKWILKLGLNAALPEADEISAKTLIEWNFLLDFDRDADTGLSRPFIGNDIGYDYLFQLSLENNVYKCSLLEIDTYKSEIVDFNIRDKTIEMIIPLTFKQGTAVTAPPAIDWVVAAIYYNDDAPRNQPTFTDKAPNEGHFVFP